MNEKIRNLPWTQIITTITAIILSLFTVKKVNNVQQETKTDKDNLISE